VAIGMVMARFTQRVNKVSTKKRNLELYVSGNFAGDGKILSYRKLQQRLAMLSITSEEILTGMQEISVIFPIQPLEVPKLRDPKDAMVLATAIASQADAIISGDSDLLILETYQNIPILTAKQFLDSL
jgi:putative PIN family toxin of toxin-antitoxin system